ncbi:MAG: DUF3854 domain-containing protein [Bryobacteraceae bacterium]
MDEICPGHGLIAPQWGGPLTEDDCATLAASWINPELAQQAMVRRVNAHEGRQVIGQRGKRDCAGLLIPYYWPGEAQPHTYRLRLDNPEMRQGRDGKVKPAGKYLAPPGGGNRLYIATGVTLAQLQDVTIPIAVVEGEKKALALWRLANHGAAAPRFIPIAVAGVWSWRGRIGKTGGPKGERLDVHGPIADLSRIEWRGRDVFIVFDANVHTNDSVQWARKGICRELTTRNAKVKLVNLPEDCGVNGVDDLLVLWGASRVLALFEAAVSGAKLRVVLPSQFESGADGMVRLTSQGGGLSKIQLTNFQAAIISNIQLDDGVETRREFEIEAEMLGRKSRFTIPASEFAAMNWPIERLGATAITFPHQRDYARTAIQSLSLTAINKCIYTHTGWRQVGGGWVYLHGGGAISAVGAMPDVNVRLLGALSRYELRLPTNQNTLKEAVRATLRLVALGPPQISFPLLAATYRATVGDADFSIHLAGQTGAFKSALAALHQQHFGAGMNRLNLPGAWSSTGNALEVLAFHGKDALFVIDDFAPEGSGADIARYHAAADRVFRAAGNHAGRNRLDSTAKLREPKPPRALILSTGEDIPRGHSIRARLLILELAKGSIAKSDLTACQADADSGFYAQAMGAYIQWFAQDYENLRAAFLKTVSQLRLVGLQNVTHARTPGIIANLQAAFESFLEFSSACGALGRPERDRLARDCWEALRQAAEAQERHHSVAEPTARFLALVRACLISGRAHLETTTAQMPARSPESCGWHQENQTWKSQGDCIGWLDGEHIYLEPTSAYRVIQLMARDMNEPFATSEQTLKKRLFEKGLLASVEAKRETLTVRRTIAGSKISVLHFLRDTLLPEAADDEGDDVR